MTEAQENAAYYSVTPAPVRYDPELSPNAKLLYGEITSLCNKRGYCWAKNSYFTQLFDLSASTISRLISQLERRGHIVIKTVATETGSERRIFTDVYRVELLSAASPEGGTQKPQTPQGDAQKPQGGDSQKSQGGVRKNRKQNDYQLNDCKENNTPYSPPDSPADCLSGNALSADSGTGTSFGSAERPSRQPAAASGKLASKPKGRRKPCRGKSVPEHKPERFEQFWAYYPGGGSRLRAVAAWDNLAPSDELIDEMARALKRQKASRQWQDGVGIPHASTWLNQQRWTDKLPEPPQPQGSGFWAPDPEVTKEATTI